ncbi:hypothetical protein Bsp3421_002196 [Burkholderia sp. FERM BP-3421]|uniref:hypothetical protein n=1 Tax=Burkholderia sp. FERM BP-3421 TaxID=1494466 RepID=UPI002361217D|nr:hypothetical protein [Burkholderia sp. FERM BP-3421]WDD92208.1 hypothetical protein Bsp3421_002196 [Burkholderia sp. FERM BP-3421]
MAHVVQVPAQDPWVNTGIRVKAGMRLQCRAIGVWVDAVIPCTAEGYPAPLFYTTGHPPRIPDDGRYFRLMGRIAPSDAAPAEDDPTQTFRMGAQSDHVATSDGVLFVFANDRSGYYWNNWGSVTLTVVTDEAGSA